MLLGIKFLVLFFFFFEFENVRSLLPFLYVVFEESDASPVGLPF